MVTCKGCIAFNAIPVNGKFCALNCENKICIDETGFNVVIPVKVCPKPVSYNEYYVVRNKLVVI